MGVCIRALLRVQMINLLVLAAAVSTVEAADWPGWRGPHGNGITSEKELPTQWSENTGIRWKVALPGMGVSTPVISKEHVFVTASSGSKHGQLHFLCLDRKDGRVVWHRRFWGTSPTRYFQGRSSMATPTPVTDGSLVWGFFGTGDLFCLDVKGNLLWSRSLVQEYERFQNRFGMSSSPLLVNEMLILQCDHWGQSYLIAIDPYSGKNIWKTNRKENLSWTTPFLMREGGDAELIVCGNFQVRGYDPLTGTEQWVARGLTQDSVPTAVSGDGLIFVTSGPGGASLAIRPGGNGDVTESHVLWRTPRGAPFVPSPVYVKGLFYLVSDKGIATCLDGQTGKSVWQKRLGRAFTASIIGSETYLYYVDEDGTTSVLSTGPDSEVLSRNALNEAVFSTPSISNGEVFIRGIEHLYCVDGQSSSAEMTDQ